VTLSLTGAQEPLVDFAHRLGIAVTAYSSLGPASYIELGGDQGAPSLMEHDVVTKISKEKSKCACPGGTRPSCTVRLTLAPPAAPAQVILRW
jgi:diketogulonate reductase-like aldo/keto reductase